LYAVWITIFGRLGVEDGWLEDVLAGTGGDLRLRGLAATGDGNSRAEKKSRAKRAKQKRSRTKIVGSTILGNAKSKMSNTWRWIYFSFDKTFRDLTNFNK